MKIPIKLDNSYDIIRVAVDVPLPVLFDYRIADAAVGDIGSRVVVPFGKKLLVGIILGIEVRPGVEESRLKTAEKIFRDIPPLSQNLLDLFRFCSSYYHHPLGAVILHALPSGLKRLEPVELERPRLYALTESGRLAQLPARSRNMARLLERFRENPWLEEEVIRTEFSRETLKRLVDLGMVEVVQRVLTGLEISSRPPLNPEQEEAAGRIRQNLHGFHPWLLFGITGSGKTEIYLQIIADILESGKQVLFLVPEINLTPHLEALFKTRFPATSIVSLHSGLNDTERLQGWLKAQAGEAGIVLGTRLAVFVPLMSPGLIIVDEEHDASFKQQEGLRYSARDVAVFRAKQESIPIVLGSATPSLESYYSAKKGRYRLLQLKERAVSTARLPDIRFLDMRQERYRHGLSEALIQAVASRLERKEQSLIFINRRGYSPALICSSCSWTPGCKRCSSRLVLHLRDRRLRCHYCGYEEGITQACPQCGNIDLRPLGHGTQRVEFELSERFPQARILRIDRDSLRKKKSWSEMLEIIRHNEVDILVGTQILAKGHDFPNLTLVGILNSDASLYSSDFRASERLFAQLTQVAGRAGRAGFPGEVLVQTEFENHPLYAALKLHDYEAMAALLLAERAAASFPPYVYQALIRAESESLHAAADFLGRVAHAASESAAGVTIFDPAIASMAKIGNRERMHLLFQSPSRQKLQHFLNELLPKVHALAVRSVRWHVDVDPLEF